MTFANHMCTYHVGQRILSWSAFIFLVLLLMKSLSMQHAGLAGAIILLMLNANNRHPIHYHPAEDWTRAIILLVLGAK